MRTRAAKKGRKAAGRVARYRCLDCQAVELPRPVLCERCKGQRRWLDALHRAARVGPPHPERDERIRRYQARAAAGLPLFEGVACG